MRPPETSPRNLVMEKITCRKCREGHMHTIERVELFHPPTGEAVEVRELAAKCDHCGSEKVLASQIEENLRRRAARKEHYGEYLLGEDIAEFRRHWGLTQQEFSKVFGKGIIAFSRYESEKAYPDLSLTRLLRIAMSHPNVLKELADVAGVELPFWQAHCESELKRLFARMSAPNWKGSMVWTDQIVDAQNDDDFTAFGLEAA